MKIKIVIILVIVLAAGGYISYSILDKGGKGYDVFGLFDFEALGFSDVDLYLSDLSAAQLLEINLSDDFGFDIPDIGMEGITEIGQIPVPEISFDSLVFNVSSPEMSISQFPSQPGSGEGPTTPPGGWTPNASDCAAFATVPSCGFVPPDVRDMCEQCKAAGF